MPLTRVREPSVRTQKHSQHVHPERQLVGISQLVCVSMKHLKRVLLGFIQGLCSPRGRPPSYPALSRRKNFGTASLGSL